MYRKSFTTGIVASLLISSAMSAVAAGFGENVQQLLEAQAVKYFGVIKPLTTSATGSVPRVPGQSASDLVLVAAGLQASILTRAAGNHADMFAFWPNDSTPTHLVFCIEGGIEDLSATKGAPEIAPGIAKLNPAVQRIDVSTGTVETVLRGMNRCDGIRRTAWGTILATEETADGQAYEILDPIATTNHTVVNRSTGAIVDNNGAVSNKVAKRNALPTMAWEGLAISPEGVVIAGDELRPGTPANADGGAIFKFIPATPYSAVSGPISTLTQSPFVAGTVHALQVSCVDSNQTFGQGCEIGNAAWIAVNAATARLDANANGATGFYRPEDLHDDPTYAGPGMKFCWTNTGNEGAKNYGEVICGIDADLLQANATARTVVINRFVEGDTDFNSFDNLAFQPDTGNLYVIEDHDNGDIFACLPDSADRDIKTDGCVKILSVKDQSAEPTGFAFTADGKTAYLSVQHSEDTAMPEADHYPTDDIIVITGWK